MQTEQQSGESSLMIHGHFASTVYTYQKPEFLDIVRKIAKNNISTIPEELQGPYVCHSVNLLADARIQDFADFIGNESWLILQGQGYNMNDKNVLFHAIWCQEYKKNAYMPQHVHGHGTQLVGFYFIETPKKCPITILHDPRPGKVQAGLDDMDRSMYTSASNELCIQPEEGMVIITNAWMPHSFTQNLSNKHFKFIHFNIGIEHIISGPQAEII